jgi:GH15 family glucan-1,4-alpha-glucosidase
MLDPMSAYPPLAELAFIGDRRTAAAIDRTATIWWYCPRRFDTPSIFAGLLEPEKGAWRIELPGARPGGRRYREDSAVLETWLLSGDGGLTVTDWMWMGSDAEPRLLCREMSRAPRDATIVLSAWRDNGREPLRAAPSEGGAIVFENGLRLFASHPVSFGADGALRWVLPKGEAGWTVLADGACGPPHSDALAGWKTATLARWRELAGTTTYDGPYRDNVAASLRQLRLLVFEPSGAIIAAVTAALPEVLGGKRDYDYRYAWLRDMAMEVRALLHTAGHSAEGEGFLRFAAAAREHASHEPLDAVVTVDGRPLGPEHTAPLAGYEGSRPVRIGNRASQQLQLDALGNFLLAAAMIYRARGARDHWDTVESVADFLVKNWREPDSGIWESPMRRHYTSSKAFVACGLDAIAEFAAPARRDRYREAARAIRDYALRYCLTREGAFAAFAGSQRVDVSAALFPLWSFCPADSAEMEATLRVLHRDYEDNGLFRRADDTPGHEREGAFLAATFWVAHYWTTRGDTKRARHYIEAGLSHGNDLGIFPEEIDWRDGRALGNLPLGLAHASFLNAAADLAAAERKGRAE